MRKAELVREDQVLRILVADDHAVIRDGLINLLDDEKDFRVVASASNGAEAVAMAKELHPDVVVMDISMPLKDGIAATAEIKAAMPDIGIVGLSMHVDPTTESRMRKAGASAYVYKTSPSDVLVKAVRDASE
jgi:DNA-binding NarL/FixJ family response regulator